MQTRGSETVDRYKVMLSQEDGVWLIEAVELRGVRSFGRTVSDAARNIREAIAAAKDLDEWDEFDLVFAIEDEASSVTLQEFQEAEWAEAKASAERDRALGAVIESLRTHGMSYRDIGTVIGLSHQRVAQLDTEAHV